MILMKITAPWKNYAIELKISKTAKVWCVIPLIFISELQHMRGLREKSFMDG